MKRGWIHWLLNRLLIACVLYAAVYTIFNLYLSSKINAVTGALNKLGAAVNEDEFQIPEYKGADAGPFWRAAAELWGAVAEKVDGESDPETSTAKLIQTYLLKDGQLRHRETLEPIDETILSELRTVVSENEHILSLLVTAAQRPGYRSTIDYTKGFTLEIPYLSKSRDIAHLTRLAAELSVLDGNREQAIEHWAALRGLARWQAYDLTLISQIVAYSIEQILCLSVQESLKMAEFTETELEHLQKLLATKGNYQQRLFASLNTEMVYGGIMLFDALLHGYQRPYNPGMRARGATRLWVKAEKHLYLALFSEYFIRIKAVYDMNTPASTGEPTELKIPWYALFNSLFVPALSNVARYSKHAETSWCLTDCAVQLKLYKKTHGEYPESLTQLPAGTGPFIDPFAKEVCRYFRKGQGFVLYSVGQNLQDNGGTQDNEMADIVVALPR